MDTNKHLCGVVYEGRDAAGERWRSVCGCGWWAPLRSYAAAVEAHRRHVAAL